MASKPSRSPFMPPRPARPPPVGPLSRVPSNPSFVPVMAIDLDAVASEVSETVGAEYTTKDLLTSLAEGSSSHGQDNEAADGALLNEDMFWEDSVPEDPSSMPLEVVVAGDDAVNFSDEALVLKIRPHEVDVERGPSHDIEKGKIDHQFEFETTDTDTTSGFAINIPVTNEPDPFYDKPIFGEHSSTFLSGKEPDEEDPLLDGIGLDMSYRSRTSIPVEGSAFVQRTGARNVAEEQEVLYAVPNAENLGTRNKGLFLPVMDSRDDLKQLMFVVPPESGTAQDTEEEADESQEAVAVTTADVIRENVDQFTAQLPGLVDIESSLEVHGTAENATVAMNVTKQVSWVGYIILGIALASVASQGTAVKWLPNVDGLIAATWLMQAQTLLMLPFAIFQYCTLNEDEHQLLRKRSTLKRIILASLSQVGWGAGFFLAIDYTLLFHAWSLNNIHALFIVLIAVFQRHALQKKNARVSDGEIVGARVAVFGVLLMQAPLFLSGNKQALIGDAIAMLSSFGAIAFLALCKSLREEIPLFLMMTPVTALNSILFSVGSMVIKGTDFSVSDNGALGWLQEDRIALGLYLGGVVGFLGTMCCIAALKFLPSVVVGSVQTMMPVVGTLVAVVAGVDTLPDFWSTVGGGVLLYGVLLIADATRQSEVTVVLNAHISEVGTATEKT